MTRPTDEEVARWAASAEALATQASRITLEGYAGRLAARVRILAAEVQRLRAEAAERPPSADAALLAQANRTLARECDALRGSVDYLQRVAAEVVEARAEVLQLRAELARATLRHLSSDAASGPALPPTPGTSWGSR